MQPDLDPQRRTPSASSTRAESVFITFHGLGEPARRLDRSELDYWVSRETYRDILDALQASDLRSRFRVTFDDGNVSDLAYGVPELLKRGLTGTVFVLAGRLGQAGYLTRLNVRELCDLKITIGSHGLNHVRWDSADSATLSSEIDRAIEILGELVGDRVDSLSIPFGQYNLRVIIEIYRRGLTKVYSSDGGPRLSRVIPIPRLTVRQGMSADHVVSLLKSAMTTWARLGVEMRSLGKGLRPWPIGSGAPSLNT